MDDAYLTGTEPVLIASGYEPPFRVNDPRHEANPASKDYDRKSDDRIIAGIRRPRFVVADFTGQRQSVYYEAGFADGLGTRVIQCVREDHVGGPSFDTRQIAHIV